MGHVTQVWALKESTVECMATVTMASGVTALDWAPTGVLQRGVV